MKEKFKYLFLKGNNWLTITLLLFVCLIPIVYKEALSDEGFSLSRIISSVLYTLPVCFLVASIKKKWLFVVVSSFLMMVSFFETIMVVLYKNFLIAGNIISALNTTADEGSGFVMSSLHALPWALPLFLVFGLLVWKYKKPQKLAPNLLCAASFIVLSIVFLTFQLRIKWGGNITTRFYVEQNVLSRPPYNFWFQSYNAIEQQFQKGYIKEAEKMKFGAKRPKINEKESYVLAIGESLRYDNLSIAGYGRKTTPLLETLDNLTLFSDYYSAANLTMYSVPQIVTRATADNFVLNYQEKSIMQPFKECGFKTFAISAGNLIVYDVYQYLVKGCDGIYNCNSEGDSRISEIVDSLSNIYPKTFFIVQFKGNHGPYNNFKKEQNVFRPNPVFDNVSLTSREGMVNSYDNTVLFTDFNVYHIIKAIDKPGYQSAFLMVSDHG